MGKRAAIYIRVNTRKSARPEILAQEEMCHRYCQERGWQVVGVFADERLPGYTLNRPRLVALRAAMVAGRVDTVVCTALEQLAAKPGHFIRLWEEMRRNNVGFAIAGTGCPADALVGAIEQAVTEYHNALRKERGESRKQVG